MLRAKSTAQGCGCYYSSVDTTPPDEHKPHPRNDVTGLRHAPLPEQEDNPPDVKASHPSPESYEILDTQGQSHTGLSQRQLYVPWATYAILGLCFVTFFTFNILHPDHLVSLTFSPGNGYLFPGLITHIFAHADSVHLLVNMFVLYFLGSWIDRVYGSSRYLVLFLASALFAALAQAFVSPTGYLLGASGGLAGVMAAFVRHFPKERLWVWGIIPIPAWLAVLLWLVYNIVGAGTTNGAGVAFSAHLGGFAAGLVMSFVLMPPGRIRGSL